MSPMESNNPALLARELYREHNHDADWLDSFRVAFDLERSIGGLREFQDAWGLSQAETAALFGVSRQACNKWLSGGVPAGHQVLLGNLSAATGVLIRNLRRDRIPVVVRRPAPALDGQTLLGLVSRNKGAEVLTACRRMFDYSGAHR